MPRAWLHGPSHSSGNMPTEMTIMRSKNPSNEHEKFEGVDSCHVASHRKRRLVSQNGRIKVTNTNIPGKRERFYGDSFTTILDMSTRYILLIYSVVYLASWSGFGSLWCLIDYSRQVRGDGQFYCIEKVQDWTSAFLFSIETQTTIGYGGRQVTPNCPEGVILLLIQTLVGSFINATLLGIIFAKVSRPKKRSRTVLFSEKAVIGKRDDRLCLMFRVGDLRQSQLVECHLQVEMYYTRQTNEGELPYFHEKLKIGNGISASENVYYSFLLIPSTIAHVIDNKSPLYKMSSLDMLRANVELVVFLEGVIESTGLTMQARMSYTAHEIVWGYNFFPMPCHDDLRLKGQLVVDYTRFNKLVPIKNMPLCCASEYEQMKQRSEDDCDHHNDIEAQRGLKNIQQSDDMTSNYRCEVILNGLATTTLPVGNGVCEDEISEHTV